MGQNPVSSCSGVTRGTGGVSKINNKLNQITKIIETLCRMGATPRVAAPADTKPSDATELMKAGASGVA